LQLPKKRIIKNLSKQIAELESKHSEKVEIKEQTYSAHQDQEQVIMQITKPIISKYSKVNIDEFNK